MGVDAVELLALGVVATCSIYFDRLLSKVVTPDKQAILLAIG